MKLAAIASLFLLAACAGETGVPVNPPAEPVPPRTEATDLLRPGEETLVSLAFSGGGTRAAAFAYGVLAELAETPLPGGDGAAMIDRIGFISGVSGGSITAAYFGLYGKDALARYPEAFLYRDAEEALVINESLPSVIKGWNGGLNPAGAFRDWLDQELFDGATMADLESSGRPRIFINATDIFNRTPFIFEPGVFAALCSDFHSLGVADAVAASAAVPVVFAPTVLESHVDHCNYQPPAWVQRAARDPSAPAAMRALAIARQRYRDPEAMRYVKLFDGGITDNIGITALMLGRIRQGTPHAPLSARDAVRVRRLLYLVVNAGQDPEAEWTQTREGPAGLDLMLAPIYAAMDNSVRNGFDSFKHLLARWTESLIRFRCSLSDGEVERLRGSLEGWNCRDLKIFVGEVRFQRLSQEERDKLQDVPTALHLPREQVDLTIAAGRKALTVTPGYRGALRSIAWAGMAERAGRRGGL